MRAYVRDDKLAAEIEKIISELQQQAAAENEIGNAAFGTHLWVTEKAARQRAHTYRSLADRLDRVLGQKLEVSGRTAVHATVTERLADGVRFVTCETQYPNVRCTCGAFRLVWS